MKLHRTLLEAVAQALADIFGEGKYADKVVERLLKSNPRWGSRDRAFIAENVYEIVRWWRLVWELGIGDWELGQGISDAELIRLVGVNLLLKNSEFPIPNSQFPEFAGLDAESIFQRKKSLEGERKTIQSVPDWMDETGVAELGGKWDAELVALNRPAAVVLRANTLKTNVLELKKKLEAEGWESETTPLAPDALVLKRRGNIFQNPHFKSGFFEVQDAGSQCIAPFLRPEPGMRVIDACAGAGGKTLHLAALMQNRGSILSLDPEAWKLEELRKRARRNGANIVQARPIESSKTIKLLHNSADRLLLDVPCSGLGTLRRNPDAKWKLSPQFLDNVRVTQAAILQNYSKMLRPGGLMVYATCSILPSENERQVERFLLENSGFQLIEERKILPSELGFDGFYMALLGRSEGLEVRGE
ncbi:MAG: methyltransferase domain-containing protein [Bacteroidetes bacterium]|nr:methyltransferase domain-containing protein [Bacteroidota bacterium]